MSKTEYTLKQYYDMVCNLYVLEFLRKHEFWDEEDNTPFHNQLMDKQKADNFTIVRLCINNKNSYMTPQI